MVSPVLSAVHILHRLGNGSPLRLHKHVTLHFAVEGGDHTRAETGEEPRPAIPDRFTRASAVHQGSAYRVAIHPSDTLDLRLNHHHTLLGISDGCSAGVYPRQWMTFE
ncbi:MAG: hypothetical protein GY938_30720 [Ketobacter sp.]|nr:hypothetical protein [Ketobacter sp.]